MISKALVGPSDLFKFTYKKVHFNFLFSSSNSLQTPIQVPQEDSMFIRECAQQSENGYYLRLKLLPQNHTRDLLLCV